MTTHEQTTLEETLDTANQTAEQISQIEDAIGQARNLRQFFEEMNDDVTGVDEQRENAAEMLDRLQEMLSNLGGSLEDESDGMSITSDTDSEWEDVPEELFAANDETDEQSDIEELSSAQSSNTKKLARMNENRTLLASEDAALSIKFAPAQKPVTATLAVCFIDVVWQNKKGFGVGKVKTMANAIARSYNDLSGNRFTLNVTVKSVDVPFNHVAKNLYKATSAAKAEVNKDRNGKPFDIYCIMHNRVRPYSNAGGNTAYCKDTSIRTGLHEIGHLKPTALEHAGKFVQLKGGGRKLEDYGDRASFMGKFPTYALNAPQLYFVGWVPKEKVAQHELTDESKEYMIEKIGAKRASDRLKAVRIPTDGRDLFLSLDANSKGKVMFMLHYRKDGGSQLIKEFGKSTEFNGLFFERQEKDGNAARIRISPALTM